MPSKNLTSTAHEVSLPASRKAAASLASCFADDVIARYYLQAPANPHALNPKETKLNLLIYECLTAAHCISGLVVSAGPNYDSSRMWLLWLKLRREGRKRFFGSWDTLEEGMTSVMGDRASITWILTDLGTIKSSRGKGFASEVEYGIGLADAKCQPVYVECCEYSVSFYDKFGF